MKAINGATIIETLEAGEVTYTLQQNGERFAIYAHSICTNRRYKKDFGKAISWNMAAGPENFVRKQWVNLH